MVLVLVLFDQVVVDQVVVVVDLDLVVVH